MLFRSAHVEMNITGPGPLGLLHETLQHLRRGLIVARSVPTRHGAMFTHNVSARDHGIVGGVEQPEYFRRGSVAGLYTIGLGVVHLNGWLVVG